MLVIAPDGTYVLEEDGSTRELDPLDDDGASADGAGGDGAGGDGGDGGRVDRRRAEGQLDGGRAADRSGPARARPRARSGAAAS